MAASQARYIELTCRKTNVEYEGQQINQQRTALANQSAGLFSQLLALNVPTPPASEDFTKLEYKFSDGINTNTITDISTLSGDPNYNSTITYYYNTTVNTGLVKTRADLGVNYVANTPPATGGTYWLTNGLTGTDQQNKVKLTQCDPTEDGYADDIAALNQIVIDQAGSSIATLPGGYDPANPSTTIGNVYKYTANGHTYYYSASDLQNAVSTVVPTGAATPLDSYYTAQIDKKITVSENAYITKDDSGRYSSINLQSSGNSTFDLTAVNNIDEQGYQDAMNEYTYQQFAYQKEVEDVNARTEVIEVEDRTLEMKLKQLDTEQEALQTEMEAVKKVIDKNIEQTFKTFAS